jgi:hypothetical protein
MPDKNKYNKTLLWIIASLLIVIVVFTGILVFRNNPTPTSNIAANSETKLTNQPPSGTEKTNIPPTNFTASVVTATQITIGWKINYNDGHQLRLYRNGSIVATLPISVTSYQDSNLAPATNYTYRLEEFKTNETLGSPELSVKTKNPPLNLIIEKVGVHNNGESGLRGKTGEVNLGIDIYDGTTVTQKRLPGTDYYHLKVDETTDINQLIFSTAEAGDTLRISIIGYENDGGDGEQFIYDLTAAVATSYITGPVGVFLKLTNVDLSTVISKLFGGQNDWLGTYTADFSTANNWGVGEYSSIECLDKDQEVGLILWFKIECPVYNYPSN